MSSPCDSCHSCCGAISPRLSRRQLFASTAAAPLLKGASAPTPGPAPKLTPLRVQPVLVYQIFKQRPQTSWRPWGGIFTETEAREEKARIARETEQLRAPGFEILPLRTVTNVEESKSAGRGDHDVLLMYASTGPVSLLENLTATNPWTIFFVRHKSGPVSEWYEIISPRFLRRTVDDYADPKFTNDDVVVDSVEDVAWRLRALNGVKQTRNTRIVALGGAAGWGAGGREAPARAASQWNLDIIPFTYDELGRRLASAKADSKRVAAAKAAAAAYLSDPHVKLETGREYLDRAFLLSDVFREVMREFETDTMTINNCMSTIMKVGETTACMPLSLLNDEGSMAFCESDFVVIPSGILLKRIAGKPVFLNDPTYPHHGLITLAHCTAPRKLDGKNPEPVRLLTHFESDYGAAPKVEMRVGETVTNLIPDFSGKRWVGFTGEILENPFHPICRSQIDVGIRASDRRVAEEMKGFHWMTGYGDSLKEIGYALKKNNIDWLDLTNPVPPRHAS